ncbi:MAG: A/G-specific adenine glycosylase [Pseudomonadota bacterium]
MHNSTKDVISETPLHELSNALLDWYDVSRRVLPWRAEPGQPVDPYAVWLSEIMLQQTTVKAVRPYFQKFLQTWPCVENLAASDLDDVLKAWAGLGYYSRARNLHACAKHIVEQYNGIFPNTETELLSLPGVGPYTAAAIAAIAFGQPATVVDGNVERVIARLFAVETPLPDAKAELKQLAARLTPKNRPGDYAQATMDLGATICSPKNPSCMICPIRNFCKAHPLGIAAQLPRKRPKPERPVRKGIAFLALREDGKVLLRKRAPKGLLGSMMEVPSTEWREQQPSLEAPTLNKNGPVDTNWVEVPGIVSHTFTHFKLELVVYRSTVSSNATLNDCAQPSTCKWVPQKNVFDEALPSVMKKVLTHGLS